MYREPDSASRLLVQSLVFCVFATFGAVSIELTTSNKTIYSTFFTVEGDVNSVTYPRYIAREATKLRVRGYIMYDLNDTLDGFIEGKKERFEKMMAILQKGEKRTEVPIVKYYLNFTNPYYVQTRFHLRTEDEGDPARFLGKPNATLDSEYVEHPEIWSTFYEFSGNFSRTNMIKYVKENADNMKIRGFILFNDRGAAEGFLEGEEENFKTMKKVLEKGYRGSTIRNISFFDSYKNRNRFYAYHTFQTRVDKEELSNETDDNPEKKHNIIRADFTVFGKNIGSSYTNYVVNIANEIGVHGFIKVLNKGQMAKGIVEATNDTFDLMFDILTYRKGLTTINEIIFENETLIDSFRNKPFHGPSTTPQKTRSTTEKVIRILPSWRIRSTYILYREGHRTLVTWAKGEWHRYKFSVQRESD